MNKKILIIIIAILIIGLGVVWLVGDRLMSEEIVDYEKKEVLYDCEEGQLETAFYDGEEDSYVEIKLPEAQTITAHQVISASGAKYQTEDGVFVFSTKGEEAFLERDGEVIYNNCLAVDFDPFETVEEQNQEVETVYDYILKPKSPYSDLTEMFKEKREIDQQLIRVNTDTGEETVVVSSFLELPAFEEMTNMFMSLIGYSEDYNSVLLQALPYASANPYGIGDLYEFDEETQVLSELEVNQLSRVWSVVSPNNTKIATIVKGEGESNDIGLDQTMYLVNLFEDDKELIINLSGNETFNAGYPTMLAYHDLEWIDDDTLRYAVYDQSKKEINQSGSDPELRQSVFIEYREVNFE